MEKIYKDRNNPHLIHCSLYQTAIEPSIYYNISFHHISKKSEILKQAYLANRANFTKVLELLVHKSQSKVSFHQSLHKVRLLISGYNLTSLVQQARQVSHTCKLQNVRRLKEIHR